MEDSTAETETTSADASGSRREQCQGDGVSGTSSEMTINLSLVPSNAQSSCLSVSDCERSWTSLLIAPTKGTPFPCPFDQSVTSVSDKSELTSTSRQSTHKVDSNPSSNGRKASTSTHTSELKSAPSQDPEEEVFSSEPQISDLKKTGAGTRKKSTKQRRKTEPNTTEIVHSDKSKSRPKTTTRMAVPIEEVARISIPSSKSKAIQSRRTSAHVAKTEANMLPVANPVTHIDKTTKLIEKKSTNAVDTTALRRRMTQPAVSTTAGTETLSENVKSRLNDIKSAFDKRTEFVKQQLKEELATKADQATDGIADEGDDSDGDEENKDVDLFKELVEKDWVEDQLKFSFCWGHIYCIVPERLEKFIDTLTFDPTGGPYVFWLIIVSLAFMYNAVVIFLRGVFPYQTAENVEMWLRIDYAADVIYLIDFLFVKPRCEYLGDGNTLIVDTTMLKENYLRSPKSSIKMDLLALLPTEVFYLATGPVPFWRLPRLLKYSSFSEFFDKVDMVASGGTYFIRVFHTLCYMLFLVHLETCGYYALSAYEGFGINPFVYVGGNQNAYIRCFYFAFRTAVGIGVNVQPEEDGERMFMVVYWLTGVFVFAFLVRDWFDFNWAKQKSLDEQNIIELLSRQLKIDLAVQIHLRTLAKVQLFKDCERSLILDLVLKLKPILFLPMTVICKKGEIGKEMYIIKEGLVEVVGEQGQVFVTLGEGAVFGEISLLGVGGNRRTATVRSKGFSNVFILAKDDFNEAMQSYPKAYRHMRRKARQILNSKKPEATPESDTTGAKDGAADEVTLAIPGVDPVLLNERRPAATPRLLKTVLKIVSKTSLVYKRLRNRPVITDTFDNDLDDTDIELQSDATDPELAQLSWQPDSPEHVGTPVPEEIAEIFRDMHTG